MVSGTTREAVPMRFVAVAICLQILGADGGVEARVTTPTLSIKTDASDKEYNGYTLRTDLNVRNRGSKAVYIPQRGSGVVVHVEAKDGEKAEWRSLGRTSWYLQPGDKHATCVEIHPGEGITIGGIETLFVRKNDIPEIDPPKLVLRLTVALACEDTKQGPVRFTTVKTEEFETRLPR